MMRIGECLELADICSGNEGTIPRTSQDEDAQIGISLDRVADAHQGIVHCEGHRVPRLGTVEGNPGDRTAPLKENIRRTGVHGPWSSRSVAVAWHQGLPLPCDPVANDRMTPLARSRARSASERPISRST